MTKLLPVLCLSLLWSQSVLAQVRSVTQWRPFLEWSVVNSSYAGNPFDLNAYATFTHTLSGETVRTGLFYDGNDTWKWRFTGTRTGRWNYLTESADADLAGLTGAIDVTPQSTNGFYQQMPGDKWGWSGTEQALVPNFVMASSLPSSWDTVGEIDPLIDEYINQSGFNGFHVTSIAARWFKKNASSNRFSDGSNTDLNSADTNPDRATFAALEQLIARTHAAGGAVHIWLWGDSARSQNLTVSAANQTGGANGVVDDRLQRYIAARLGPLPGWSIGYGYDLFEWTNDAMLTEWHRYLSAELGWPHYLGARGRKNVIQNSQISEALDYVSYEQHPNLFDFDDYVTTHQDRPGRPSFTEDRFRIRVPGAAKDLDESGNDTRTLMWDLTMAGGIAAIWGNLYNGQTNQNSSLGSLPYNALTKAQLKTFDTFWNDKKRFRADLSVNAALSSDADTRVLVNSTASHWVLYRQNSNRISVDASVSSKRLRAIAVNTRKAYEEVNLGVVLPQAQTLQLPSTSDWAVSLSEISNTASDDDLCTVIKAKNGKTVVTCF